MDVYNPIGCRWNEDMSGVTTKNLGYIDKGDTSWEVTMDPYIARGGEILPYVDPNIFVGDLNVAVAEVLSDVSKHVKNKLISGFTSDALGTVHRYSSDMEDQMNLLGSVTAASIVGNVAYNCVDELGVMEFREHTKEQIIEVGLTFDTVKRSILSSFTVFKVSVIKSAEESTESKHDTLEQIKIVGREYIESLNVTQ